MRSRRERKRVALAALISQPNNTARFHPADSVQFVRGRLREHPVLAPVYVDFQRGCFSSYRRGRSEEYWRKYGLRATRSRQFKVLHTDAVDMPLQYHNAFHEDAYDLVPYSDAGRDTLRRCICNNTRPVYQYVREEMQKADDMASKLFEYGMSLSWFTSLCGREYLEVLPCPEFADKRSPTRVR